MAEAGVFDEELDDEELDEELDDELDEELEEEPDDELDEEELEEAPDHAEADCGCGRPWTKDVRPWRRAATASKRTIAAVKAEEEKRG